VYSGDRPEAATQLGQTVGADESRGGLSPDDKLAALRALQAAGRRAAMVGDGLNDAPVLAGADVSFAFGQAVPIARSRSDFVALTEQLSIIADTLAQARRTLRIVRQNLVWAAVYNLVAVPLAIAGYMPAWAAGFGMAASSLLVVLNALRLAGKARLIPNKPVGIDSPTAEKVA
jgi:Cu2+-exporting ATPase